MARFKRSETTATDAAASVAHVTQEDEDEDCNQEIAVPASPVCLLGHGFQPGCILEPAALRFVVHDVHSS